MTADPLTTRDAATYLGFSPELLWKWRRLGTGPRFEKSAHGPVRYAQADLDAFMAAHTVETDIVKKGGNHRF